ncbi:hypothetical protein FRB90_005864 [Tulasnella sp. 427]|nr:hypothetical protein FRB90_005864 [Tulasnella sp. 427]
MFVQVRSFPYPYHAMSPPGVTFNINIPDSREKLEAVVTQCHSCGMPPTDFVLTCVGCLQYSSRQLYAAPPFRNYPPVFRTEPGKAPWSYPITLADVSKLLVPLIPRQKVSSSLPANIVSELQARYSKLRFSRNCSLVGIFASVGLAVFTHGGTLFGLLFSGPKFCYYNWKLSKLKKLMKQNGVPTPKRRIIEFVAPLLLGTIVAGVGLEIDSFGGIGDTLLTAAKFLSGVGSDAASAVKDLATTSGTPLSEAFDTSLQTTLHAFNPDFQGNAGGGALDHHLLQCSQQLYHLADSVQQGQVLKDDIKQVDEEGIQECISHALEKATWKGFGRPGRRETQRTDVRLTGQTSPIIISQLIQGRTANQSQKRGENSRSKPSSPATPHTQPGSTTPAWPTLVSSPSRTASRSSTPSFPIAPYGLLMGGA